MRFIIYTLQLYLHLKNAFKVKVKSNYLSTYNIFIMHFIIIMYLSLYKILHTGDTFLISFNQKFN